MKRYNFILFDADGTLFDFNRAEFEAFEFCMKNFGVVENIYELHSEYEIINKSLWNEFEQRKISASKLRTDRFKRFFDKVNLKLVPEDFSKLYLRKLSEGKHLIKGAEEIIKYFYKDHKMALATNGLADVQYPRFKSAKINKYFSHVYVSEEIGYPKPNINFFKRIFSEQPYHDSTIIVGDNLISDIKGGNDFGIDTCWFNENKRINDKDIIPTYEINELKELKNIIV